MSHLENEQPQAASAPLCPHCETQLDEMGGHQWLLQMTNGLLLVLAAYCPHCRKGLGFQTLILPPGKSGIVPPN